MNHKLNRIAARILTGTIVTKVYTLIINQQHPVVEDHHHCYAHLLYKPHTRTTVEVLVGIAAYYRAVKKFSKSLKLLNDLNRYIDEP